MQNAEEEKWSLISDWLENFNHDDITPEAKMMINTQKKYETLSPA